MKKVGFTGTQNGMTIQQFTTFAELILSILLTDTLEFHHGCCIGADNDAHGFLFRVANDVQINIYLHLPINQSKMMMVGDNVSIFDIFNVIKLPAKEYLERNKDIVDATDILIACPKSNKEELRSGTWATVRYAKKKNKEIWIINPDGTVKY